MRYDIFLGGPWERHAPFPYKTMIKEAFPGRKFFDPETKPSEGTEDWFKDNFRALEESETMVALVPTFPFPGVAPETGMFYYRNCAEIEEPLEQLVIIWPEIAKPDYGKKVAEKMGYVVDNPDAAICALKKALHY